ncbi:insulinase family protein [bacterium]|nr:insulinase family protein [bacterium]
MGLNENELGTIDRSKCVFGTKSFGIIAIGLLVFLSMLSGCNENKGDVKEVDISSYIDVKEVVLDNGLTVLVVPDPSASLVSIKTFVRAGSIDEQPFLGHGLSHYLEHVVAGGSTSVRTEDQYKEKISLLGGAFNAYTTTDHTSYYINTVPEFTLDGIDILNEWMFDCEFNQKEFDREHNVIIKEIEKNDVSIQRKFYYQCQSNFFKYSPVKYPVIGYLDNFKKTSKQALMDYYKQRYIPSNMILAVGGNVDADEVIEYAKETFGKRPMVASPVYLYEEEPESFSKRMSVKEGKTNVTYLSIRFSTVDLFSDDLYPLDLLDFILGNGENSILYQLFVEDTQLAFNVNTSSNTPTYTNGYFEFYFETKAENVDKIVSQLETVIQDIKNGNLNSKQIEKAKKQKLADDIFSITSIDEKVSRVGQGVLYGNSIHFFEDYINNFSSIKPKDVVSVAKTYLNFDRVVITVLKPETPQDDEKTIVVKEKKNIEQNKPVLKTLENGVKLIMYHDSSLPKVYAKVMVLGGLRSENEATNGVSNFVARLLGNGAVGYEKRQLKELVEGKGAEMEGASGRNTIYYNLDCLSDDFNELFPLFLHTFFNPEFNEKDFSLEKSKVLQWISQREDEWYRVGRYEFNKQFFKGHPYSLSTLGEVESVESLTVKDLRAHFDETLNLENLVITIFGDFNEESAIKDAEVAIKKVKSRLIETTASELAKDFSKIIDRPLNSQNNKFELQIPQDVASIFIGFDSFNFSNSLDKVKVDLMNSVLSGMSYPGGRLHNELREHGLVYVVQASNLAGMEPGAFVIVALSSKDKIETVESMIFAQVESLQTDIISDKEFELAVAQLRFYYKDQISTLDSFSMKVATDELYGRGFDYYQKLESELLTLTKEDVQTMAIKYFIHPQTFIFSNKESK